MAGHRSCSCLESRELDLSIFNADFYYVLILEATYQLESMGQESGRHTLANKESMINMYFGSYMMHHSRGSLSIIFLQFYIVPIIEACMS